jgi:hypothetical protein
MSIDLVRMRFAAVAARIETTGGVDAIGGIDRVPLRGV